MASLPTSTGAEPSSNSQFTYASSTASYFPTPFHLQQAPPVSYIGAAPPAAVQLPAYPAPPSVYSLPQFQQAQHLFQRDAQTISPEALESVKAALASSEIEHKTETKKKAIPRKAAGQAWEDPTLAEWPESKYVGNRPIKLRKSTWRERTDHEAIEKQKNHFQKKTKAPRKRVLHK